MPYQPEIEITGPDSDGFVWLTLITPEEETSLNLGPQEHAAEGMSQWLGSIDYQERDF